MRFLIVEDVWIIAADLQEQLERLGHTVVGIVASRDALERTLASCVIDCVFLDYDLGGGATAEPLLALLRKAGIPYVWTSAYEGRFAGPSLRKPFLRSELAALLAGLTPVPALA
jgi:CheY-like chemotaxis protein